MNYTAALERLYKLNRFHRFKYNLEAVRSLAGLYGDPQNSLRFIHVTGTNGKGSVTFKTAKVLEGNGLKTGLFTSPHLSTFRERIQVNGALIEKDFITEFLNDVFGRIGRGEVNCSFFEVLTVMALRYFKEQQADVVCLEVGIGGKMDATNIIDRNLLAIITSIGLDHCNLLGDTVEEIAIQKCGIIKRGCPVLAGPEVPGRLVQTFAKRLGSDFYQLDRPASPIPFWQLNEQLAEKAIGILNSKYDMRLRVLPEELSKNLPGRREIVPERLVRKVCGDAEPPKFIVLDVGHNEMAIRTLLESLRCEDSQTSLIVVYGTSGLKDSLATLRTISGFASEVYLVQGQNNRAKPISDLKHDAGALGLDYKCVSEGNIQETLRHLFSGKSVKDRGVVICGSFFIMEEVRDFFGFDDEKDFVFLNEYHSL